MTVYRIIVVQFSERSLVLKRPAFANLQNGIDSIYTLTRGRKKYEASNHLGNVMVVFTDKRINQCINDSVQYYRADLRSAYDYYPFGMLIPDRTFDSVAYVQLPDRVDTTINQRIKIQISTLNPGQIISLSKDGETYVLAQYQSGYTGAQYSANIAGSAIVNELSFEDSAGYLIIENTTLGGQTICFGIPSFSLNIAGTNYALNCNQSIDTIRGGLLSEAGYLFGFNTQERDDEIKSQGNSLDFGARIYDSRLGRFLSVDKMYKLAPNWTPFRFALNNPVRLVDRDGNYETDGHYWTVYMLGLSLGLDPAKAEEIAYYTEKWDTEIHGSSASLNYTWAYPSHQQRTHALTGGSHEFEEFSTAVQFLNADINNTEELERLLHRYEDTYAHSHLSGDGMMYGEEGYHTEHAFAKEPDDSKTKVRPDKIYERPDLYKNYVRNMAALMATKLGGDLSKVDFSKFDALADYASKNKVSLIGIMNYEVAKMQGLNSFVVQFARGLPIIQDRPDHDTHVSNTMNYLNSQGVKNSTEKIYKHSLFGVKWGYLGTKFTIQSNE